MPDPERPGSFVVRLSGIDQSYVDPTDPTHLEFDYVQRIAAAIDAWRPPPDRIAAVHIGGGGLTLPRWLAHTRPTSAQVVLEPDVDLTAEVRRLVPLPVRSGIKVRLADGRTGLAAISDARADLVVLDAFAGGRVPGDLATAESFAAIDRVLAPGGLLAMNLTDRAPFAWSRGVVAGALTAFGHVALGAEPATFKGRRFGNLVLLAAAEPLPTATLARRAAGGAFGYRLLDEGETRAWAAGARPFRDAFPVSSDGPPVVFLR